MHQTRKGNQCYFGMKAHIGVDSKESQIDSLCSTAASVADKHMLPDLSHSHRRAACPGHDQATDQIRQKSG
jgi:IS5 family transposase